MADPVKDAVSKVEDAVLACLTAATDLSAWTVSIDQGDGVALEDDDYNAIVIRTIGPQFDPSFEYGAQTLNTLVIDIEAAVKESDADRPRRAREGLAAAHAALMADHTLGGMLQDLSEVDLASAGEGRDVAGRSIQYRAMYFTAPDDLLTILGHGGDTF